jgi:putative phage-type endonuclease
MAPVIDGEGGVALSDEAAAERAWLVDRRSAITATDVPAILGLSPFSSPIKVWRSKIGDTEDQADSEAMYYGRLFERPILMAYEKRTAQELVYPEPFRMMRSLSVPQIGATLDARRLRDGAPVDAKNVGFRSEVYGDEGTDNFPAHYAAQLMMQMFVTGAAVADLAVLFSRYDFKVYTIEYDRETAEGLVARCLDWYQAYVVGNTAPPVDGTPDYTAFVKRLKQATDMVIVATPEQEEWARNLSVTREQLEMLDMEKSRLENLIKTAIGEAKGIESPRFRALWSQAKDSVGPDLERIAYELAKRYVLAKHELALDHGDLSCVLTAEGVLAELKEQKDMQKVTRTGSRRFTFKYEG